MVGTARCAVRERPSSLGFIAERLSTLFTDSRTAQRAVPTIYAIAFSDSRNANRVGVSGIIDVKLNVEEAVEERAVAAKRNT